MNYEKFMQLALQGRTVNATAKAIGIPQPSLDRYVKGERIPGAQAILVLADAAGVSPEVALKACALHEALQRPQASFVKKFLTSNAPAANNSEPISEQGIYVMLNRALRVLRRATDAIGLPAPGAHAS